MSSPRARRARREVDCVRNVVAIRGRALSWRDRAFRSRERRGRDGWRSGGLEAMQRPSARKRARERCARVAPYLGEGGHDVAEASGLAEGRALGADHDDVEAFAIGADDDGGAVARGGGAGLRGARAGSAAERARREGRRRESHGGDGGGERGHGVACAGRCRMCRSRWNPRGCRHEREKKKKTAVDGLGEPLSARQVGRTRNLLGTPQIRNPLEAGRTKSRFCLRPFARRNTVAPRCELTRTFDPPRSRARPSRARADPCRCAARVSGPTSAPAARAFFPNAPRCVVRSARPAECFFRPRG